MPYKNIHWIKLQTRLINDHRFFTMSEKAQLYYVKLLILCAETSNKVPRNYQKLRALLRTTCDESTLKKIMQEIRTTFPKVMETKDFYFIRGFKQLHNWVVPGSSPGTAKVALDKSREDKEKNIYICNFFSEEYKKETGVPYPINYGKDRTIFKDLLTVYDKETLKQIITEYFESARDPKEWHADKLSIGNFKHMIPQIIGKIRKKN